jgi:hypothetical protein
MFSGQMSSPQAFTNCVKLCRRNVLLTCITKRQPHHPEDSQLWIRFLFSLLTHPSQLDHPNHELLTSLFHPSVSSILYFCINVNSSFVQLFLNILYSADEKWTHTVTHKSWAQGCRNDYILYCGSSHLWILTLLHVTHLVPKIFRRVLDFWKICATVCVHVHTHH